jgi:hypothetical protein
MLNINSELTLIKRTTPVRFFYAYAHVYYKIYFFLNPAIGKAKKMQKK